MIRFEFNWDKAIQAIDFISRLKPGITQYYIGKIIFFADREHILDYGRPITGDRFIAMEHGPVPSAIRDLLKLDSSYPDEMIDMLHERVVIEHDHNKLHVYSKKIGDFPALSGSDKSYLEDSCKQYANMSFGKLRELSHQDPAYEAAWAKIGAANEMEIEKWLSALDDPEKALDQLREKTICAR